MAPMESMRAAKSPRDEGCMYASVYCMYVQYVCMCVCLYVYMYAIGYHELHDPLIRPERFIASVRSAKLMGVSTATPRSQQQWLCVMHLKGAVATVVWVARVMIDAGY